MGFVLAPELLHPLKGCGGILVSLRQETKGRRSAGEPRGWAGLGWASPGCPNPARGLASA